MINSNNNVNTSAIADIWDGIIWLGKLNSRIDGFRYGGKCDTG